MKINASTLETTNNMLTQNSSIFGMTCDGLDVVANNINTPV
jgi:hypothetical protein